MNTIIYGVTFNKDVTNYIKGQTIWFFTEEEQDAFFDAVTSIDGKDAAKTIEDRVQGVR